MTIEDILKVLWGLLGIWLGIGGLIYSFREPNGLESKIFPASMICFFIGMVTVAETVAPGSVGTLIKSMFNIQ